MSEEVRTGVLGRVPDDLGGPLTAATVESLAVGTEIIVIWSGGNGPHHYVIGRDEYATYAAPTDDPEGRLATYNPLTFIGGQRFHTRVWVAAVSEKAGEPR